MRGGGARDAHRRNRQRYYAGFDKVKERGLIATERPGAIGR
jgi:hypothetical protein